MTLEELLIKSASRDLQYSVCPTHQFDWPNRYLSKIPFSGDSVACALCGLRMPTARALEYEKKNIVYGPH